MNQRILYLCGNLVARVRWREGGLKQSKTVKESLGEILTQIIVHWSALLVEFVKRKVITNIDAHRKFPNFPKALLTRNGLSCNKKGRSWVMSLTSCMKLTLEIKATQRSSATNCALLVGENLDDYQRLKPMLEIDCKDVYGILHTHWP